MIKKSAIITIIFIFNAFIQLINQIAVTRIFGAQISLEIFLAAVALPTTIVSTIYSTLNDAFLPLYGEKRAKNKELADKYFLANLLFLIFISFVITLIMVFFSKQISFTLYKGRGWTFVNSVALQMSYMFFSLPLAVCATLFGTYYYTHKKFIRFPLAQAVGNLTNFFLILLLSPFMGVWALVFAFVVNIFFQILLVLPSFKHFEFNLPKFKRLEIRNLLTAWIPLIVGYSTFRSEAIMIRSLAAHLPTGYMVYLNLITKIFTLATGVMTIGIQILLLPHLVEYFENKHLRLKGIALVNKAKIVAVGVSVVVAVSVILIAPIIVNLLFIGGKFSKQDAMITNSLFPLFLIPSIGWGTYGVFFQPLLALKKQLPLAIICLTSLVLGWGIGNLISDYFGPLVGISCGLIILLFTGIIGSEILWQYYKKKTLVTLAPPSLSPPIIGQT